jgi:hypothetical protein
MSATTASQSPEASAVGLGDHARNRKSEAGARRSRGVKGTEKLFRLAPQSRPIIHNLKIPGLRRLRQTHRDLRRTRFPGIAKKVDKDLL